MRLSLENALNSIGNAAPFAGEGSIAAVLLKSIVTPVIEARGPLLDVIWCKLSMSSNDCRTASSHEVCLVGPDLGTQSPLPFRSP